MTCRGLAFAVVVASAAFRSAASARAADAPLPKVIEFNRDIRPILSDNCFACHGPDKNKRTADLRLDTEADAFADRGGHQAIVAAQPDKSELIHRVTAENAKVRMPPAKFGKTLTPRQVALLKLWIEQGAKWQKHWSLIPPTRPEVPAGAAENPIDRFVQARLAEEGLKPSPEADKRTLIRRLSFDLTGLPPTPQEVDAFVADAAPDAYGKLVDRLLASPHFGERMALYWLDLVRFADSAGYHSDNHRDITPYRDYVICAFNANKPFHQFTIEQLAGDLLPDATNEQKIASGYNRLLMTTEEGGAQAKEYLAKYAADRVRNASSVWLGTTLGCAECHDHKFDPFSTRDFYRFAAFFADLKETAVGRQAETKIPTEAQSAQLKALDAEAAAVRKTLDTATPELEAAQASWEQDVRAKLAAVKSDWTAVRPEKVESSGGATLAIQDDLSVLSSDKNPDKDTYTVSIATEQKDITGIRLEALTHPTFGAKSLSRGGGNFVLTKFEVEFGAVGMNGKTQKAKIASAVADYSQKDFPVASLASGAKSKTGWAVDGATKVENRTAVFAFDKPIPGGHGTMLTIRLKHESPHAQHNIGRFRLSLTSTAKPGLSDKAGLPAEVAEAVLTDAAKRTPAQKDAVAKHYRAVAPLLDPARKQLADIQKRRDEVEKSIPQTLVSMAVAPRVIRVLPRGNWLDDSGEIVQPGVPGSLSPMDVKDRRATRLDLAKWLMAADNPLPSRVIVNRLWKLMFGRGIATSLEDLGSQGTWPTHPALLDWLAVEFREGGWDVKRLLKSMVTSSTYRQSSHCDEALRQRDPYNRLLARQDRWRLDAEMVRDNALAVSGLLVKTIGGASVKPYQPPGYWSYLNFPKRDYVNDKGESQYRRGLYTYWQRTFHHPSLAAFDAPSREECTVERPRSNTPLQALVLLNDPTYVESARTLAERVIRDGGADAGRLDFAFRQVLSRKPTGAEAKLLVGLHQQHKQQYDADKPSAAALLAVGDHPAPKDLDAAELAAMTSVCRVILNLHEAITRN